MKFIGAALRAKQMSTAALFSYSNSYFPWKVVT